MTSIKDKKITLYGDILKETAALEGVESFDGFGLPAEEDRQRDLQYILAIFVSSGMNLNGGVFLPSELVAARNTIINKPLDIEHLEGYVIGHIQSKAFMTKERKVINPVSLFADLGNKIDKENLDIAVLMSLYRNRFPDVAEEVEEGKYKVSMECYYKYFDIKVGDIIISREEADALGIRSEGADCLVGKRVKLLEPGKAESSTMIGRVFRDILFSGCGLVEYPANPESDILAAASTGAINDVLVEGVVIDLGKSETYLKNKQEQEALEIPVPGDATVVKDDKDKAGLGPLEVPSSNPGRCVNFKKYVYSYQPKYDSEGDQEHPPHAMHPPGFGDDRGPNDVIIHESWCTLFDTGCTSLAGDATHPYCLRNVLNRTTTEAISNFYDLRNDVQWDAKVWETLESLRDKSDFINDFLSRQKK